MCLPKISIVTPSLNQAGFLEETMLSILNQDYPNLEYIVIDGGSNDGSVDIIKKYEDKLHFWASEKDEGHGHAINKGFSHASGDIMTWINSDDKHTLWSLKAVAQIFTQFPHVMWIVGFNACWNSDGIMISCARRPKNIYDFLLGNYTWIQQENVFWRRSLWEKAGGHINQEYKLMVDGELWTRFFLHEDLYSVDSILGGYRTHSTNRGQHNYLQCHKEMRNAISIMKQKCSADVLKTYAKLEMLRNVRQSRFCKYIPISRLAEKRIPSTVFETIAYKNIFYQNDMWTERKLPFSLQFKPNPEIPSI